MRNTKPGMRRSALLVRQSYFIANKTTLILFAIKFKYYHCFLYPLIVCLSHLDTNRLIQMIVLDDKFYY